MQCSLDIIDSNSYKPTCFYSYLFSKTENYDINFNCIFKAGRFFGKAQTQTKLANFGVYTHQIDHLWIEVNTQS